VTSTLRYSDVAEADEACTCAAGRSASPTTWRATSGSRSPRALCRFVILL